MNRTALMLVAAALAFGCEGAGSEGTTSADATDTSQEPPGDAVGDDVTTPDQDCCSALVEGCGLACSLEFPEGTVVTNSPSPDPTSTWCDEVAQRCGVMSEQCTDDECLVPAGSARGGATVYVLPDLRWSTPFPHTIVVTRPFWMMRTEVTNAQWMEVMGAALSPSLLRACGDDCPVADMNHFDVADFANRLSARAGLEPCYALVGCDPPDPTTEARRFCDALLLTSETCTGYRLPTEVEWEMAARAGSSGCWSNGEVAVPFTHCMKDAERPLRHRGWFCGNSHVDYEGCVDMSHLGGDAGSCMGVKPVGRSFPNRLGLFDMHGNAWEMTGTVREVGHDGPEEGATVVDPGHAPVMIPSDAYARRGGAFGTGAGTTCAYFVQAINVIVPHDFGFTGFRLVRLAADDARRPQ